MEGKELLKNSAYCYHGFTISKTCKCNNKKGRIYKDTKGCNFCLDCNKDHTITKDIQDSNDFNFDNLY